ncbi:MAG: hypothetical protein ABEJ99_06120 [Candidatus Nanohaloarchaea archaeon]
MRDRIPEIIEEDREKPVKQRVDGEELSVFLRTKLVEDAEEFGENCELEELADILEVLERVFELVDEDRVRDIKKQKKDSRGGFSRNIVLEDIE